ncbi:hypothetical protein CEXT_94231 [Caerostris extrusa]|uniref:Uncharacterized protein n=1 Tax=Caerostris extrusa TaxID=172846 RepID=A0AAV4NY73_CAEEX|nr:hypothetical protein CEXT_94231 [Caerostris extrusa]
MHGNLIRASTIAKELAYGRPESRVAARAALAVGELCGGGSTSPSRALSRGSGRSLRSRWLLFLSCLRPYRAVLPLLRQCNMELDKECSFFAKCISPQYGF